MTNSDSSSAPDVVRPRLESVDFLRGLVMVVMALDHTRDFFGSADQLDPTNLETTNPFLFFTRIITHYCAPTFVFLAGTAVFLSLGRGKGKGEVSRFLVTRGLWLVLLEITVIRFWWSLNLDYHQFGGAVIWALGWSMVALAALIHLPIAWVGCIGVAMILTHNAADGVTPESWGSLSWLWKILHVQSRIQLAPDVTFGVAYPLIPWVGVMAAGYSFGHFFRMEAHRRQRLFLILGTSLIAGFLLLRFTNWYGDANPWSSQKSPIFTVMSFVNCRKYPPSLLYLLMTLGPGIVILSRVDRGVPRFLNGIVVFGKVPMFYYLLHLPLLHFSALILMRISGQPYDWMFKNDTMPPPGAGFGLPVIYVAWACAILILYPLCRWFAGVKQRNRSEWLSYF